MASYPFGWSDEDESCWERRNELRPQIAPDMFDP
jgi:hypothetical protein